LSPLVALWFGALAFLALAMTGAWQVQRLTGQGGWVDAIWSYAVGLAGVGGALWPLGAAPSWRQWLVGALFGLWSLRLGTHVARRAATGEPDPRYAKLIREWGSRAQAMMFGFLMLQALAGAILVASVLLAARREGPLGVQDAAATLVYLIAVGGEALADAQLARCKADPAMKGKVCDRGLWAWSRHPNYFFEWLGWCAWPVFAIGGSPWGWLTLSGAAYMFWLLRYVSGVPPLEEHMSKSRPQAFAAYAARTSIFFPRPPKA
jgi:steroid 5-alpha reductase family enzyme